MATGGGAGVAGRGLQAVGKSKGEKRVALGERPDTSGVVGENKLRKMSEPVEWIVMFKVRGQKPGEGGFRALNPLRVTAALVGMGFQARTLSNGLLSKDKKLFEEAKEVGKLVVKVEGFLPKGGQGPKGVIYGVYACLSGKEIMFSGLTLRKEAIRTHLCCLHLLMVLCPKERMLEVWHIV